MKNLTVFKSDGKIHFHVMEGLSRYNLQQGLKSSTISHNERFVLASSSAQDTGALTPWLMEVIGDYDGEVNKEYVIHRLVPMIRKMAEGFDINITHEDDVYLDFKTAFILATPEHIFYIDCFGAVIEIEDYISLGAFSDILRFELSQAEEKDYDTVYQNACQILKRMCPQLCGTMQHVVCSEEGIALDCNC